MTTGNINKIQSGMSLYDLTPSELESFFVSIGEKNYRAKQVLDFLYRHPAKTFDEITTLPVELREKLGKISRLAPIRLRLKVESSDGAVKHAYEVESLAGKSGFLESVWMPSEYVDMDSVEENRNVKQIDDENEHRHAGRNTLCISSQLGCSAGCAFCASGAMGLKGQLSTGEIVYQVIDCIELYEKLPDTVLFMGMGEPMHNFDSVCAAVEILTHKDGPAMSPRRIVVSSAGELERLGAFHKRFPRVRLAISLNAATDAVRSRLMPVNDRYGIKAIESFIKSIDLARGEKVTLEYVVIKGLTDVPSQINALETFLVTLGNRVTVNLIPYNEVENKKFGTPNRERVYDIQRKLRQLGVNTFIRRNRGTSASAACGQLSGKL